LQRQGITDAQAASGASGVTRQARSLEQLPENEATRFQIESLIYELEHQCDESMIICLRYGVNSSDSKGAQQPFGQGWGECPTCEGEACSVRFAAAEFTARGRARHKCVAPSALCLAATTIVWQEPQ
jgi:hypothetical protein